MSENKTSHIDEEKEKVSKHYDIDPQVFELFLDENMNYSCAYFEEGTEGLDKAQQRKMDLIAQKIDLNAGNKLLDVGCGWGNVLLYYSKKYDCNTTGLTIAENQAKVIKNKAEEMNLGDKVSVVVEHFQETSLPPESFDKIIFIGSIVHIEDRSGAAKLTHSLLKNGGKSLISETYLPQKEKVTPDRASNFISQEIFGYGNLITPGEEIRFLEEAGFELLDVENITDHYVKTLDIWIDRIKSRKKEIDETYPGQSKKLRTYLTLARRALKRRTSLQQQIVVQKLPQ